MREPYGRRTIAVGTVFGRLVVADSDHRRQMGTQKVMACLVRCSCGTEKVVPNTHLRRGAVVSCGCTKFERCDDSDWKRIRGHLVCGAKTRGFTVALTVQQVKMIGQRPCFYCKAEPRNFLTWYQKIGVQRIKMEGKNTPYSGIDRVNTWGNYEPGNILPCCQFCNFAKAAHPLEFFIEQLNRYGSSVTAESVLAECYLLGKLLEADEMTAHKGGR